MPHVAYHPFLFGLLGLLAAVQVGLTAYTIYEYNHDYFWPNDEFKNRLIFLCFCASWTLLFALLHWLFNLLLGIMWTLITFVFWLVGSILFHKRNHISALHCDGTSFDSICRMRVAIESVSWACFAITTLLLLALIFHIHSHRHTYGGYYGGMQRGWYDY